MTSGYVFIIGAMKSGTTTLFDWLAGHPQVAPSHPKEPGFFAFEEKFGEGLALYHRLFDFDPDQHRWRLDGSTDYSKFPYVDGVPDRMKSLGDTPVKIIYMMRHPIRRMESHAKHVKITGCEIGQQALPEPISDLSQGPSSLSFAASEYARQIDQYEDYFQRGDMLLLTMEEMIRNPKSVQKQILDFLDLSIPNGWAGAWMRQAPKRRNKAGSNWRRHPLYDRLKNTPGVGRFMRTILPPRLRQFIRKRMRQTIVAEGRFTFTEDEEHAWFYRLIPDLTRLNDHYGIDVKKHWGIDLPRYPHPENIERQSVGHVL